MINEINLEQKLAEQYQNFSKVRHARLEDFLQLNSVHQLAEFTSNKVDFSNAFFMGNQNKEATDQEIERLSEAQKQEFYQELYKLAANGIGFLYGRHKITEQSDRQLTDILKVLNSDLCLNMVRKITRDETISYADGQVTRYCAGDYLTRHVDNIEGETRRYAYVLGLSPNWHPDWGGLLQFFDADGTPNISLAPQFNSLTVFDVNKVHSVTSVANFSPANRYSITGWFRA